MTVAAVATPGAATHPDWCNPRLCWTDRMSGERFHQSRPKRIGRYELHLMAGDNDEGTVWLGGLEFTSDAARREARHLFRVAERLLHLADVAEAT